MGEKSWVRPVSECGERMARSGDLRSKTTPDFVVAPGPESIS